MTTLFAFAALLCWTATANAQQYCACLETMTAPTGTLTDHTGGGDYLNNMRCQWAIQPEGGDGVELTFTRFNTEAGWDYVRIYDGTDSTAPLLFDQSGTTATPNPVRSSGPMYVVWTTDGSVVRTGWEASYTSFDVPGGANIITLPAVIRDFTKHDQPGGHPDFGSYYGGGELGVVEPTLGADDTPVYNSAQAHATVTSADSFSSWYHDTTYSHRVASQLVLRQIPNTLTFGYETQDFFPVDCLGSNGNDCNNHNFFFTLELHATFQYRGGEVFSFRGDDDVWVFINKQLVLDLGGVHPPLSGVVALDTVASTIGMTIGGTYAFDFFFAERQTCGSTIKIETTIDLIPQCGNGVVEADEECDTGDAESSCCRNCRVASAGAVCRAAAGGCDVAETCSGTSIECPADAFAGSSTVCRTSAGPCDVAERCSGTEASCPADSFASSSTECRSSAGACDVAETCTGSDAACPTDAFADADTECRASAGVCDVGETCTGSGAACPANTFASSTTECRASEGICDVAETCTGSAAACPADTFASSTAECRASDGVCDVAETCTGSSAACPADEFHSAAMECRASAGVCDVAETCTGSSAACPDDSFESATTVCRSSTGVCDPLETCTGSSASCPADMIAGTDVVCRAPAGDCDAPEYCDGASSDCIAPDAKFEGHYVCRLKTGECDCAETCDGVSDDCPVDLKHGSEMTCRPSAGQCDVAETCNAVSNDCPADAKRGAELVCRASVGVCDSAETCDGANDDCPSDSKFGAETTCRAAAGVCDAPDVCDGSGDTCPPDAKLGTTTVCRASAGACDPQEVCPGNSNNCPHNRWSPSTTICRPVAGASDKAEYCSGSGASCPSDKFKDRHTICHVPTAANNWCDRKARCTGDSGVCPVRTAENCEATPKCLCHRRSNGGYEFLCLSDAMFRNYIQTYPKDVQWLPSTGRRPTSQADCNTCPNDYDGGHDGGHDGDDDDDRDDHDGGGSAGYSGYGHLEAAPELANGADAAGATATGAAPQAALIAGVVAAVAVAALVAAGFGVRAYRRRQGSAAKPVPTPGVEEMTDVDVVASAVEPTEE